MVMQEGHHCANGFDLLSREIAVGMIARDPPLEGAW